MNLAFNREKVCSLRGQLQKHNSRIPEDPGVYRWWFPVDVANKLLAPLSSSGVDTSKIQKENIDGKEFWCLYFGIASSLLERANWHISQHHTESTVKNGVLSTLRQTISALLGIPMTQAEDAVNKVLDTAYWDWHVTQSEEEAGGIEKKALENEYYPLNIQENKGVSKEILTKLKDLRKEYKR